ncbi:hypothetical protein [Aeromonas diversa]|uniref:hypothetical protein n=1 Tax=Aeromonas diversa TaxID=502790 RepID=UPI00346272AF
MKFPTDKIYKFYSFNDNSLSALAMNSAWFSNVRALNDPFEAMVNFKKPSSKDEKIEKYVKVAARSVEGRLSNERSFQLALQRYYESPDNFLEKIESFLYEAKDVKLDKLNSLNVF